jgi:hypothetical protein
LTPAIRVGIPAAAVTALLLGILLPASGDLPAVALGSREVLWAERSLVFFYGFLLLFVPLVRALAGELPIELSARGARYAEASNAAVEGLNERLDATEQVLDEAVELLDELADRVSELE